MCPRCRSHRLKIKQSSGIERLLIFLSGMRTYRCRDCNHSFHMPDRRRFLRAEAPAAGAAYSAARADGPPR
jgi:DNA-directed RNA polymerase subunit RPC12/RpoP